MDARRADWLTIGRGKPLGVAPAPTHSVHASVSHLPPVSFVSRSPLLPPVSFRSCRRRIITVPNPASICLPSMTSTS